MNGDVLIADTVGAPASGRLVIASVSGQIILAELRNDHGRWLLISGDGSSQPLYVDPAKDVEIWGTVTALVRTEV